MNFTCRICVSILGVVLDRTLDGMLNSMLDGTLDRELDGMLVGVAEGTDDANAGFACDKSSAD